MHGDCHSLTAKLPNILLLVKYIIENSLFHEQLDQIGSKYNLHQSAFLDLFADNTTCFTTGLKLNRYVCAAYRN